MNFSAHIENLFPTPLYISSVDYDFYDLNKIKFESNSKKVNTLPELRQVIFENHVELSESDQILKDAKYADLNKIIDLHVYNYYYNILGYSSKTQPYMCASWIVKSSPGQSGLFHDHSNSILSGVFYIDVPKNSGAIIFNQYRNTLFEVFKPDIQIKNQYNTRLFRFEPKNKTLILFPSYLLHKVIDNLSDGVRYSLAFNYFLKGSFGNHTSSLEL